MSNRPTSSTAAARNKLIVRRLPPQLPEDIFWRSAAAWVNDDTCLWKRYVQGSETDARTLYSRAYVLMVSTDALVHFHRGYDGHIFRSKSGSEYQAVVEFAPYQKTPFKARVKADARQGTIDEDPDYKSFLESLAAPLIKPALETSVSVPQPTTTPLLDHLRANAKPAKSKGKAKANQKPRDAALASVNTAAAGRMPQKSDGVVMVAGKGRGVIINPAPEGKADDVTKKKRAKKNKLAEGATTGAEQVQGTVVGRGASRGGAERGRGRGKTGGQGRTSHEAMTSGGHDIGATRGRGSGRGRGVGRGYGGAGDGSAVRDVAAVRAGEARIDM